MTASLTAVSEFTGLTAMPAPAPAPPASHLVDQRTATVVPPVLPPLDAPPQLRTLRGVRREDALALGGAAMSGISLALLTFGRLAPLAGPLGFTLVAYASFVVIYAFLVSFSNERPIVADKVVAVLLASATAVAGIALTSVLLYVFFRGGAALVHLNLFWQDMSEAGPLDPLSKGGIAHALVGTLIIIAIALVFTVPLGLAVAVFLNESRSRAQMLVRTVVNVMTALPSILAGLFILATWILIFGFPKSGLAAAMATSIMMLPIIVRSAELVLRLVPGSLREAAAALGAPQWRTVWHVVLPTARPGLATSVILGVARGIGETAPVLLTAGFTSAFNLNPLKNSMVTLPLATFDFVRTPQETLIKRGFAAASVLMAIVLILFFIARMIGGRPAGRLTAGQQRRVAARSARDAKRFGFDREERTA